MVVSIAMLGIGLSGTLQAVFPWLKDRQKVGIYALLLGLSIPLGFALTNMVPFDPARLAWDREQLLFICLYYLILSVPFFFFGLVMSSAFALESQRSAVVYGADLLGAGAGSVVSLLLIAWAGPERAVVLIAMSPLLGAYLFGRRSASVSLALILALGYFAFPGAFNIRMSPYKELHQALLFPGASLIRTYQDGFQRVDVFNSPMARFAPGLSLSYLNALPGQLGVTVDGTGMSAITDARLGPLEFTRHMPSALPYSIRKIESALLAEPRGGLPVLMARGFGVEDIHVADSSPLLIDVIDRDFSSYSGGIYKDNTYKRLARSALISTGRSFDLIDISMLDAVPAGSFGISEDYRFTLEAFSEYFRHLGNDGMLSLSLYVLPPQRTELRLLTTSIAALESLGVDEPSRNIVAIRSWGVLCILFKVTPFQDTEVSAIKGFADRNGFDLVYYHGITGGESGRYIKAASGEPYANAFMEIVLDETRAGFIKGYPFDITPAEDNRPFFHYYIRASRLKEIYELSGRKWQFFMESGYVLPAVLVQAVLLSLLLLVLPSVKKQMRDTGPKFFLSYFALLGAGFMFIEIPLIQKMILPFETPALAVATVLASVLISSGMGSLASRKFSFMRTPFTLFILAALSLPYILLLSPAAVAMGSLGLAMRVAACFVIVFPLGAMMGIPFPLGMSIIGQSNPDLVPWAWAVNGCLSVISPLLAVLLAISIGYTGVIMLGAALYMAAFLVLRNEMRDSLSG